MAVSRGAWSWLTLAMTLAKVVTGIDRLEVTGKLYIVGRKADVLCVALENVFVDPFPLTFLLDGVRLETAHRSISNISDTAFLYTGRASIKVTPRLQGKEITCRSTIGNVREKTEFISVVKVVQKPVIVGPKKIVHGLRFNWTCTANGSTSKPAVIWVSSDGKQISKGITERAVTYRDTYNIVTYNVSSTLVVRVSHPVVGLQCKAKDGTTKDLKLSDLFLSQVIECPKMKELAHLSEVVPDLTDGYFEFEQAEMEVNEPQETGSKIVEVKVRRHCNVRTNDSVTWVAIGSAKRDALEEYSGTVMFPAWDTANYVKLVLLNNDKPELEKTLVIRLQNATKGKTSLYGNCSEILIKILANDDPYGYFTIRTIETTVPDEPRATKKAQTPAVTLVIERKGGNYGEVNVSYRVDRSAISYRSGRPSNISAGGKQIPDFGNVLFAACQTNFSLKFPPESVDWTMTLLSAKLVRSPQKTPVPNSPRLGSLSEITARVRVKPTQKDKVTEDKDRKAGKRHREDRKDKKKETDQSKNVPTGDIVDGKSRAVGKMFQDVDPFCTAVIGHERRRFLTNDILYLVVPVLSITMVIIIISLCCCCAYCGRIRKVLHVGDVNHCSCCSK